MTASVLVRAHGDRSDVIRGRHAGALRLLFPRAAGKAAWIVTSSLGGGLVDGDDLALDVVVEADATCLVTTQASTKAYRGTSRQRTRVQIDDGGLALVLPDPVVPYRDARFTQRTEVELAAAGSLVLADVITAGRVEFGERWSAARIDTTLAIRVAGELRLLDRIVLDREDGEVAARLRRFESLATAVLLGPRMREPAATLLVALASQRVVPDADVVVAASPLADGAIVRIAARRVELGTRALRVILREACLASGEDPWSRKW